MSESLFEFGFTNHRKIRRLSDAAFRLWITAIDNCNENGVDGTVLPDDLDGFARCPTGRARTLAIAELVDADLWHDVDGYWVIHDFAEWQAAAQERAAKMKRDRERARLARDESQGLIARTSRTDESPGDIAGTDRLDESPGLVAAKKLAAPLGTPSDPDPGFKLGTEGSGNTELPVKASIPGGRAKRKTRLPADWQPTEEHRKRAAELGLNLVLEVEKFRLHAEATGRLMVSWNATFSTWLLNAERFASEPGKRRPPGFVEHQSRQGEPRHSFDYPRLDPPLKRERQRTVPVTESAPAGNVVGGLLEKMKVAP